MGSAQALSAPNQDELRDAIWILDHLAVPNADDRPSLTLEELRSAMIILGRVGVLTAVEFDCQLRFAASQIDDVRADNQLTRETWTITRQAAPKRAFGISGIVAKAASVGRQLFIDPLHSGSLAGLAVLATTPNPSLVGRGIIYTPRPAG